MGSYSTMKHLLVLAIFGFVCARSAPGPSSRVYGGGGITEFEFPFVLSFQHYRILLGRWDHVCGASLINPQWAVLSATCLKKSVPIDCSSRIPLIFSFHSQLRH